MEGFKMMSLLVLHTYTAISGGSKSKMPLTFSQA
jgi:hypothetical protein